MRKRTKISLWIIGGIAVIGFFLFALIFLSTRLIHTESIKNRIKAQASQAVKGNVDFRQLDVSFFPTPRLTIHQCSFTVPETVRGSFSSLTVHFKIFPLFFGKFRGAKVYVHDPDIEIKLHEAPKEKGNSQASSELKHPAGEVGYILGLLSKKAPGLAISVDNGRLNILPTQNSGLSKIKASNLNLTIEFKTKGPKIIQALFEGSIPDLTIDQKKKETKIRVKQFNGDIYRSEDRSIITLRKMKLDSPAIDLNGRLDMSTSASQTLPEFSLKLEGKHVDVNAVRRVTLDLGGGIPVVRKIFEIVKGGQLPFIDFSTRGNSVKDLDELENIIINSQMVNGEIFVPKVDLDLKDVQGQVTISKGILNGRHLKASLGQSRCLEGRLELGLKGKDAPFELDINLDADLAQLPPILKRVVNNDAFLTELSMIDDVNGRATGRLYLGSTLASIRPVVKISKFNLSANYHRLPYPLKIENGRYLLEKNRSSVKNLIGKMGKSTFTGLSGWVDWEKVPDLEVESGAGEIDLQEMYPWLNAFKTISEKLQDLQDVRGIFAVSSLKLHGPMLNPFQNAVQVEGSVRNLTVKSSLFPETLEFTKGMLTIQHENISFMDAQTRWMDASLIVSGTLKYNLKEFQNLDLKLQGELGPKANRWTGNALKLPRQFDLKPPLRIESARLTWHRRQGSTFSGDLTFPENVKISTDVMVNNKGLTVEKLDIQDGVSDAAFRLDIKNRTLNLSFSGELYKTTLDHIITQNRTLNGWIIGNWKARLFLDQPLRSTFQGELRAKDFIFPWGTRTPMIINDLSMKSKENTLRIESASGSWVDGKFDLKGEMNLSADRIDLNVELSNDSLNIDRLTQALKGGHTKGQGRIKDIFGSYPLYGVVKFKSENLTYGGFTWSPFRADITFSKTSAIVSVTEASLCNIETPGTLQISPTVIEIDVDPAARNQKLDSAIYCLLDKSVKVKGFYDLEGNLATQGKDKDLIRSLQGRLKFSAGEGRFYSGTFYGTLIKIFRLVQIRDLFRGELPNLTVKGFGYYSIDAKADIQNGKITINEMIIDGISAKIICRGNIDIIHKKIDMKALVAPLKTVDYFVEKIPVANYILDGSLISVPVKITGPLKHPMVTALPPSAVGSGLLGILKRTLQFPIKLIQPVQPPTK